jgi:hypothetical protein
MPGAVGDVFLDQDPEAWRDAVETSAYVADNSVLRKRGRGRRIHAVVSTKLEGFRAF